MAEGESIGLTGVFDGKQFTEGLAGYNAAIDKSVRLTEKDAADLIAQFSKMAKSVDTLTKENAKLTESQQKGVAPSTKEAGKEQKSLVEVSGILAVAMGALTGNGVMLAKGLMDIAGEAKKAADEVGKFVMECVSGAATGEEAGLAAQYMGQQAGYTAKQISDLTAELIKTGVTDLEAGTAISKFTAENLDATQAVDLLKVAQGASIMTHEKVTDVYNSLISAIANGTPRALKQYQLTVDQTAANQAYADTLGVDVKLLTDEEKKQAMLNAVLEKGAGLQGLYAEAMQLPAAQLRNLTGTLIPKLMDAVGTPFQDAFAGALKAVSGMVEWITTAISEGGALYPVMSALAAAASLIGDALGGLAKMAQDAGNALFGSFGGKMAETADASTNWGVNIVTNLANGIMQGAADALMAAMNAISQMLSDWLSPGSPPKVAPDIDKWGAGAIGEWLHGFTQADFSTLDAIQGPLQTALNSAFGKAGSAAAADAFKDLSAQILTAIDAGKMSAELFDEISAKGGEFGKQIAILVKDQIDLNNATKEAAAAQEALVEAQKAGSKAGAQVSALTKEYNNMLRNGASKEELAQKLLAIKAAEKDKALADKAGAAAQSGADAANEKADALKKQVALQTSLVAQQQKLAAGDESAAPGAPAAPKLGGAGGVAKALAGLGGGVKIPTPDLSGLTSGLNTQIDKLKTDVTGKFQELWAQVAATAGRLWAQVQTYLQPTIDNITGALAEMTKFWDKHKGEVDIILRGLWAIIVETFKEIVNFLGPVLAGTLEGASGLFKTFWQLVNGDFEGANATITGLLDKLFAYILGSTTKLQEVRDSWQFVFQSIVDIVRMAGASLDLIVKSIELMITLTLKRASETAQMLVTIAFAAIQKAVNDAGDTFSFVINNVKLAVNLWVEDMKAKAKAIVDGVTAAFSIDWGALGRGIIDGIRDGVMSAASGLAQAAADAVRGAIAAARNALGMHSPSRVFVDIGRNTMKAMGEGIQRGAAKPEQAMVSAMGRAMYPAAMVPVAAGGMTSVQMNMGGVSIYNPMNMALFESMLTRVMRGATGK